MSEATKDTTGEVTVSANPLQEGSTNTPQAVVAVKPVANNFRSRRPSSFNNNRRGGRPGAPKSDLEQKVLSIRRVARVIAGGKRFTFSVCLVAGDKKGKVGVGMAKAGGTSEAIDKALRDARKNMIQVNTTKGMSIPHEVEAKYCAAIVALRPALDRGLIAGSAPRVVLALAGITDTNAKILSGSKNKVNNARATIEALKKLR
ncbi:MAG: 30S ribosomal protein S5 [Candidatus Vogelbacteria bacterium]|nr:30S ribosomal protein S5 [Candidatus Vogelbacteria bacterium]